MAKIIHKKSSVANKVPLAADLEYGELAVNYQDERVYFKNSGNQIRYVNQDLEQAVLNYPQVNPSLLLDFMYSDTIDPRITFQRSSIATYTDKHGVLQTAANNIARLDHNPVTGARLGLLIEESRTNSIRNNTMQGAVAGTPGTLPTNWQVSTSAGLTTNVIGSGTESGVAYVDIQIVGTPTTTQYVLNPETGGLIAAAIGQSWSSTAFLKQVAGSQTNISSINLGWSEQNSVPAFLAFNQGVVTVTTTGSLASNRKTFSAAISQATAAFVRPVLSLFVNLAAIDITLRIGLPQLEQGAFATSVIPTTTAAVTRAADVASVNTLSPWFNAVAGTLYTEATSTGYVLNTNFPLVASLDDGTNNNRITASQGSNTNSFWLNVRSSSVSATLADTNVDLSATPSKLAGSYFGTSVVVSVNGGSAITGTTNGVPTGLTGLYLGNRALYLSALNGHIRRITYYPQRLSNAELQSITT